MDDRYRKEGYSGNDEPIDLEGRYQDGMGWNADQFSTDSGSISSDESGRGENLNERSSLVFDYKHGQQTIDASNVDKHDLGEVRKVKQATVSCNKYGETLGEDIFSAQRNMDKSNRQSYGNNFQSELHSFNDGSCKTSPVFTYNSDRWNYSMTRYSNKKSRPDISKYSQHENSLPPPSMLSAKGTRITSGGSERETAGRSSMTVREMSTQTIDLTNTSMYNSNILTTQRESERSTNVSSMLDIGGNYRQKYRHRHRYRHEQKLRHHSPREQSPVVSNYQMRNMAPTSTATSWKTSAYHDDRTHEDSEDKDERYQEGLRWNTDQSSTDRLSIRRFQSDSVENTAENPVFLIDYNHGQLTKDMWKDNKQDNGHVMQVQPPTMPSNKQNSGETFSEDIYPARRNMDSLNQQGVVKNFQSGLHSLNEESCNAPPDFTNKSDKQNNSEQSYTKEADRPDSHHENYLQSPSMLSARDTHTTSGRRERVIDGRATDSTKASTYTSNIHATEKRSLSEWSKTVPSVLDLKVPETESRKEMFSKLDRSEHFPQQYHHHQRQEQKLGHHMPSQQPAAVSNSQMRDMAPSTAAVSFNTSAQHDVSFDEVSGEEDDELYLQSQLFVGGLDKMATEADVRSLISDTHAQVWIGLHGTSEEKCGFVRLGSFKKAKQVLKELSGRTNIRLAAAMDFENFQVEPQKGKQMETPVKNSSRESFFQDYVLMQCPDEPLLGVCYITEYIDDGMKPRVFVCSLCLEQLNGPEIANHIVGFSHRVRFFNACQPTVFKDLCDLGKTVEFGILQEECAQYAALFAGQNQNVTVKVTDTPQSDAHTDMSELRKQHELRKKLTGAESPKILLNLETNTEEEFPVLDDNAEAHQPASSGTRDSSVLPHEAPQIFDGYQYIEQLNVMQYNTDERLSGTQPIVQQERVVKVPYIPNPQQEEHLVTETDLDLVQFHKSTSSHNGNQGVFIGPPHSTIASPSATLVLTSRPAHHSVTTSNSPVQVYIGNWPQDATHKELQGLLKSLPYKDCHIKVSQMENIKYGSIDCETYADARELMKILNEFVFKGRLLRLRIDQNLDRQQTATTFEGAMSTDAKPKSRDQTRLDEVVGQSDITEGGKTSHILKEQDNKADALREAEWKYETALLQERSKQGDVVQYTSIRQSKLLKTHGRHLKRFYAIGLPWVTEVQKSEEHLEPWFLCYLCHQCILWNDIKSHLTSLQHRLNYLKKKHKVKYDRLQSLIQSGEDNIETEARNNAMEVFQIEGFPTRINIRVETVVEDTHMAPTCPNRAILASIHTDNPLVTVTDIVTETEKAKQQWEADNEDLMKKMAAGEIVQTGRPPLFGNIFSQAVSEVDSVIIGLAWLTEIQNDSRNVKYLCSLCRERFRGLSILPHLLSLRHRLLYMKKCHSSVFEELEEGWASRVRLSERVELWAHGVMRNEPVDTNVIEVLLERPKSHFTKTNQSRQPGRRLETKGRGLERGGSVLDRKGLDREGVCLEGHGMAMSGVGKRDCRGQERNTLRDQVHNSSRSSGNSFCRHNERDVRNVKAVNSYREYRERVGDLSLGREMSSRKSDRNAERRNKYQDRKTSQEVAQLDKGHKMQFEISRFPKGSSDPDLRRQSIDKKEISGKSYQGPSLRDPDKLVTTGKGRSNASLESVADRNNKSFPRQESKDKPFATSTTPYTDAKVYPDQYVLSKADVYDLEQPLYQLKDEIGRHHQRSDTKTKLKTSYIQSAKDYESRLSDTKPTKDKSSESTETKPSTDNKSKPTHTTLATDNKSLRTDTNFETDYKSKHKDEKSAMDNKSTLIDTKHEIGNKSKPTKATPAMDNQTMATDTKTATDNKSKLTYTKLAADSKSMCIDTKLDIDNRSNHIDSKAATDSKSKPTDTKPAMDNKSKPTHSKIEMDTRSKPTETRSVTKPKRTKIKPETDDKSYHTGAKPAKDYKSRQTVTKPAADNKSKLTVTKPATVNQTKPTDTKTATDKKSNPIDEKPATENKSKSNHPKLEMDNRPRPTDTKSAMDDKSKLAVTKPVMDNQTQPTDTKTSEDNKSKQTNTKFETDYMSKYTVTKPAMNNTSKNTDTKLEMKNYSKHTDTKPATDNKSKHSETKPAADNKSKFTVTKPATVHQTKPTDTETATDIKSHLTVTKPAINNQTKPTDTKPATDNTSKPSETKFGMENKSKHTVSKPAAHNKTRYTDAKLEIDQKSKHTFTTPATGSKLKPPDTTPAMYIKAKTNVMQYTTDNKSNPSETKCDTDKMPKHTDTKLEIDNKSKPIDTKAATENISTCTVIKTARNNQTKPTDTKPATDNTSKPSETKFRMDNKSKHTVSKPAAHNKMKYTDAKLEIDQKSKHTFTTPATDSKSKPPDTKPAMDNKSKPTHPKLEMDNKSKHTDTKSATDDKSKLAVTKPVMDNQTQPTDTKTLEDNKSKQTNTKLEMDYMSKHTVTKPAMNNTSKNTDTKLEMKNNSKHIDTKPAKDNKSKHSETKPASDNKSKLTVTNQATIHQTKPTTPATDSKSKPPDTTPAMYNSAKTNVMQHTTDNKSNPSETKCDMDKRSKHTDKKLEIDNKSKPIDTKADNTSKNTDTKAATENISKYTVTKPATDEQTKPTETKPATNIKSKPIESKSAPDDNAKVTVPKPSTYKQTHTTDTRPAMDNKSKLTNTNTATDNTSKHTDTKPATDSISKPTHPNLEIDSSKSRPTDTQSAMDDKSKLAVPKPLTDNQTLPTDTKTSTDNKSKPAYTKFEMNNMSKQTDTKPAMNNTSKNTDTKLEMKKNSKHIDTKPATDNKSKPTVTKPAKVHQTKPTDTNTATDNTSKPTETKFEMANKSKHTVTKLAAHSKTKYTDAELEIDNKSKPINIKADNTNKHTDTKTAAENISTYTVTKPATDNQTKPTETKPATNIKSKPIETNPATDNKSKFTVPKPSTNKQTNPTDTKPAMDNKSKLPDTKIATDNTSKPTDTKIATENKPKYSLTKPATDSQTKPTDTKSAIDNKSKHTAIKPKAHDQTKFTITKLEKDTKSNHTDTKLESDNKSRPGKRTIDSRFNGIKSPVADNCLPDSKAASLNVPTFSVPAETDDDGQSQNGPRSPLKKLRLDDAKHLNVKENGSHRDEESIRLKRDVQSCSGVEKEKETFVGVEKTDIGHSRKRTSVLNIHSSPTAAKTVSSTAKTATEPTDDDLSNNSISMDVKINTDGECSQPKKFKRVMQEESSQESASSTVDVRMKEDQCDDNKLKASKAFNKKVDLTMDVKVNEENKKPKAAMNVGIPQKSVSTTIDTEAKNESDYNKPTYSEVLGSPYGSVNMSMNVEEVSEIGAVPSGGNNEVGDVSDFEDEEDNEFDMEGFVVVDDLSDEEDDLSNEKDKTEA